MKALVISALLLALGPAAAVAAEPLQLERFFSGRAVATGEFRNALDGTTRGITVRFDGRYDRAKRLLVLAEDIRFSDGERQHKTWRLTRTGPRTYSGTREDVVGTARGFIDDRGRVILTYDASVGSRTVSFHDVLALRPDGSVRNEARLSYFILHVGDVTLDIRRRR
jgi:hypothetical protein